MGVSFNHLQNDKKKNDKIKFKKYAYGSTGSLLILIMWFAFFAMNSETNWNFFMIPLIIFLTFTALIAHHNFYYITIEENEIIIKNLFFFWFKKSFKLENIEKVTKIKKNAGKSAWYGIIIHLKKPIEGYKFYMDSLRDDFWSNIKKELNNLNIEFDDKT